MRALLFDPARREILLIKALVPDTGDELWFTPGGGKEEGETDQESLAREVLEETGLAELPPSHLVWTRSEKFRFMGDDYHQDERYYFGVVERFEPGGQGLEAHEQETFLAAHWWPLEDILESTELFVPADLGKLLIELERCWLAKALPAVPIPVGR